MQDRIEFSAAGYIPVGACNRPDTNLYGRILDPEINAVSFLLNHGRSCREKRNLKVVRVSFQRNLHVVEIGRREGKPDIKSRFAILALIRDAWFSLLATNLKCRWRNPRGKYEQSDNMESEVKICRKCKKSARVKVIQNMYLQYIKCKKHNE